MFPKFSNYQHIYFSPHLDDVVLSCAANIALQTSQGDSVLVVTIFTGLNPQLKRVSSSFSVFQDIHKRKEEDKAALKIINADYLWLDYPDAIQRNSRSASLTGITKTLTNYKTPFIISIQQQLIEITQKNPSASLYFPLAIGSHIDHQIVYLISTTKQYRKLANNQSIFFYEDTPYKCIPHLLKQRFLEVGINPSKFYSSLNWSTPLLYRVWETTKALVKTPALGKVSPIQFLFLIIFILYRFSKAVLTLKNQNKTVMSAFIVDIKSTLPNKIRSISQYYSQISILFRNEKNIAETLYSCSKFQDGDKNILYERYWKEV